MYVVDASVWVSRFMRSDRHHDPSRQWLLSIVAEGESIVSPAILLPEVGGPITRVSGRPDLARRILSIVEQAPNVTLVPVDASFSRYSAHLAVDLRLRGADSLYVALALRLGIPLITWDREQLERGSTAVSVFTPNTVLE